MKTNMRLVALILILIAPTWAVAWRYNETITLKDLNPIYVSVNDGAKGGCWTNIMEAKTYLSDKLEIEGAVLTDNKEEVFGGDGSSFSITVNGRRHATLGICYGTISITTQAIGSKVKGVPHRGLLSFSEKARVLASPINFNDNVLDVISDAVEEWK